MSFLCGEGTGFSRPHIALKIQSSVLSAAVGLPVPATAATTATPAATASATSVVAVSAHGLALELHVACGIGVGATAHVYRAQCGSHDVVLKVDKSRPATSPTTILLSPIVEGASASIRECNILSWIHRHSTSPSSSASTAAATAASVATNAATSDTKSQPTTEPSAASTYACSKLMELPRAYAPGLIRPIGCDGTTLALYPLGIHLDSRMPPSLAFACIHSPTVDDGW